MKKHHTYTLENDGLFFRFKESAEALAICTKFVRKVASGSRSDKVQLTARKKNPKEKGFVPLTLIADHGDNAVYFKGQRFYVCYEERRYLKQHGFGDKFWIKIEVIS